MTLLEPMNLLGLVLSGAMGWVLGALGGGGSVLTVPILLYLFGLGPRETIATSLLVVGITSLIGLVHHARAGQVRYKTGLIFGLTAMVGAYGGGRLAEFVPAGLLIGGFALMMLATGIAMLRRRGETQVVDEAHAGRLRPAAVVAEGLAVGAVTGLVGAGGGFLVVPALVLLGGVPLRAAIGTSLLVVSMKSFAGLAGHLGHVGIDLDLALAVTAAASLGAVAGGLLGQRLSVRVLRRAFAALVIVMSFALGYGELPEPVRQAVFVDRWPFWAGGLAIGAFVVAMLVLSNKPLGVSTGFSDLCAAAREPGARRSWRLPFLLGIVLGGVAAAVLGTGIGSGSVGGLVEEAASSSHLTMALSLLGGGVLIGFGTRLADGCTSGHGIVGMAQLARSSMVATASFMATAFVVANILSRLIGG